MKMLYNQIKDPYNIKVGDRIRAEEWGNTRFYTVSKISRCRKKYGCGRLCKDKRKIVLEIWNTCPYCITENRWIFE